jgi:phosphoribosylcarboxyaminoimidazole (NCAIR) mutase
VSDTHIVVNCVGVLVAAAGMVWPVPGLVAEHGRLPAAGVPDGVLVLAGALLIVAVLGPLVDVRSAVRGDGAQLPADVRPFGAATSSFASTLGATMEFEE